MKLIAKRDFRNSPAIKLSITDAKHPLHVHKGAEFEIGTGKNLNGCTRPEMEVIGLLMATNCAVDASNDAAVKIIKEELADEEKAAKAREAKLKAAQPAAK